ncbi:hypothetical protein Daus18300_001764 [Diaporthe australafricana]|uniref:MYND-type domain-containing protein n=1 Tax=Diaporthe australafricana TaxID=127596 RepID=A0ABR3XU19_9PEZI
MNDPRRSRPVASVDDRQVGLHTNYANREDLIGVGPDGRSVGVPDIPLLAMKGWLCVRCLAHKPDLKACGACKMLFYCSAQCQKVDWGQLHKQHCKAFRSGNDVLSEEGFAKGRQSFGALYVWLTKISDDLMEKTDKVAPSIFENQPYCNSCYRSAYQLKLLSDEQFYSIDLFNTTGNAMLREPIPVPLNTFTEMASLSGWFDYYKTLRGGQDHETYIEPKDFSFAPNRAKLKSMYLTQEGEKFAKTNWAGLRVATMASIMSMTIANALYVGLPDLRAKTSLLIHVIGASSTEWGNLMMFEEILHLFPNLNTIKVFHIGPKTPQSTGKEGKSPHYNFIDLECCPPCSATGRQRWVATYRGLYHDFVKIEEYTKPDLAVLFHSGRSQDEIESWAPTTRFLVDQDITTACTTYTRNEADEEMYELEHALQAKIIQRIEENKWKGLVPSLETMEEPGPAVYYSNYYWYMFRGKA